MIADEALISAVARELAAAAGGNGSVRATLPVSEGREATLLLGRTYALDPDLAMRLTRLLGVGAVELTAHEGPKLALVG